MIRVTFSWRALPGTKYAPSFLDAQVGEELAVSIQDFKGVGILRAVSVEEGGAVAVLTIEIPDDLVTIRNPAVTGAHIESCSLRPEVSQ